MQYSLTKYKYMTYFVQCIDVLSMEDRGSLVLYLSVKRLLRV